MGTPTFEQVTIENIPFDIVIDFTFMDKDVLKDDEIGKVSVSFQDIKDNGPLHEYPIIKGDKKRGVAFFAVDKDEEVENSGKLQENAEEKVKETTEPKLSQEKVESSSPAEEKTHEKSASSSSTAKEKAEEKAEVKADEKAEEKTKEKVEEKSESSSSTDEEHIVDTTA